MLKYWLFTLLILVMSSIGCAKNNGIVENFKSLGNSTAYVNSSDKAQGKENEVTTVKENPNKLLFTKDMDNIIELLDKNGTIYSAYVYVPKLDAEYTYNNKHMGSASMIKVFILEKAYSEIAKGNFSEDIVLNIESDTRVGGAGSLQGNAVGTPVKAKVLLEKMIIESDNTATNMLIKYFGMDNINAYMQERGYTESLLCRRMMDYESLKAGRDNVTSVKDLGLFFKRLLEGNAVNPSLDARMIEILAKQEDCNKIPYYLPKGTIVAHKTGEINSVMNDGGIVFGNNPYVVCILTDNAPGYNLSIKQVAAFAKSINEVIEKNIDRSICSEKQIDNFVSVKEPSIVDKPVINTDYKKKLMREYASKHYGKDIDTITPKAIVVHWTASDKMAGAYNWFDKEEYANEKGTLNVGSQFMVDRDGTIYRLMPETTLARHSIGYNWCAIGIENVGGTNSEDLTDAQLKANIELIRYLSAKYNTIGFVWGHYQQDIAKESGLYIENIKGYYSGKSDPGPRFMGALRMGLGDTKLKFFKE